MAAGRESRNGTQNSSRAAGPPAPPVGPWASLSAINVDERIDLQEKVNPMRQISNLSIRRVPSWGEKPHSSPQDAGSEFYRNSTPSKTAAPHIFNARRYFQGPAVKKYNKTLRYDRHEHCAIYSTQ